MSAPYALKAGDAQTLGGLSASAFVLAAPPFGAAPTSGTEGVSANSSAAPVTPATISDVTTTGGTVNTLPLFSTATNIHSSVVRQIGRGTTGKIGINTTTPATTLDVKGAATVRGTLTSTASGTATAAKGFNSQPQDFVASVFNSTSKAAVPQTFQWQAEPVGKEIGTATGTLNILYGSGTAKLAENRTA